MKYILMSLFIMNSFAQEKSSEKDLKSSPNVKKETLSVAVDYYPKAMTWTIPKTVLGNVIKQKMIFKGNGKSDQTMKVKPLEMYYNEKGTFIPTKMLSGDVKKRDDSLIPYIEPQSSFKIPHDGKISYDFRVKTTKEMTGCYFFSYFAENVLDETSDFNKKNPSKNTEVAFGMQFKLVSPGYLHIQGTEVYDIKGELNLKKGKSRQELIYDALFEGNCLVAKPRVKVEIKQGNKVVFTQNKLKLAYEEDRALLPNTKFQFKLPLKLKKGKYKVKLIFYSQKSEFENFHHMVQKEIQI